MCPEALVYRIPAKLKPFGGTPAKSEPTKRKSAIQEPYVILVFNRYELSLQIPTSTAWYGHSSTCKYKYQVQSV